MTEQHTPATQGTAGAGTPDGGTAVVGPLTIRDLTVLGSVLIIFVASLIPLLVTPVGGLNLWNTSNLFYIGIGMVLPLATGALFLIRRFSPGTKLRLGSLSLDQFASVVAVFAAFFFFAGTVTNFEIAYLVGLIGALLFVAATTLATWIPVLAADFAGRAETVSHVVARDAVAPAKRPSPPKPSVVNPVGQGAHAGQFGQSADGAGVAGASADGQAAGAAAWAASRPAAAGHTAAGQVFTPAKDGRPADAAGTDAATSGAAKGAAAASGATMGTADAATPAASSATPASGTSAAATPVAAAASNTAGSTKPESGIKDAAANTDSGNTEPRAELNDLAVNTHGDSVQEPATTINPQLAQAASESKPVQQATAPAASEAVAPKATSPAKESIAATVDPKAAAPAVIAEPFWFAVDRPQNVIDEKTRQFIYKLTPGSWILALEDRGTSFLVQDGHGKTGVLFDLVGIERASDSQ